MRIFATGWSDHYDGPGRRWVIYLKGCDLRCRWCASPESQSSEPEMLFHAERARFADRACRRGAVKGEVDTWRIDRQICQTCHDHYCATEWCHPAFTLAGEEMSVSDIVASACEKRAFWTREGGVTFGGGEPTIQLDTLLECVEALRNENIHVAIETNAGTPSLERLFGQVSLLICDLKCVSADLHRDWTGRDNHIILDNLRQAVERQPELWIRIPFIPGFNDSEEEKDRILTFLADLPRCKNPLHVEVLRLHHLGEPKYAALQKEYPMRGVQPPTVKSANRFIEQLRNLNLDVTLGG